MIEVTTPIYQSVSVNTFDNFINIFWYPNESQFMEFIRSVIKDINNKKISNYSDKFEVTFYGSKENIAKLKENTFSYYDEVNNITKWADNLEDENNKLKKDIYNLESILKNSSLDLVYDDEGNIIAINE